MPVATASFLAEHLGQEAEVLAILRRNLNESIENADRRLALPRASRALKLARDRAARSVLRADALQLVIEVRGMHVTAADVELAGLEELEAALDRDAVRTFRRAPITPVEK